MLTIYLTSVIESNTGSSPEALELYLAKIVEKDTQALADLYRSTNAAVYAFALSILKNPHDAEDALHDCYVQIFANAASYHAAGKPMAWIMTITRNLCMQKFRERRKSSDIPQEDWDRYLDAQEDASQEDRLVLRECLQQLSDDERQIVTLHAVNGFKHREIAELLQLPLPTVLSKYHRALKKLKKFL